MSEKHREVVLDSFEKGSSGFNITLIFKEEGSHRKLYFAVSFSCALVMKTIHRLMTWREKFGHSRHTFVTGMGKGLKITLNQILAACPETEENKKQRKMPHSYALLSLDKDDINTYLCFQDPSSGKMKKVSYNPYSTLLYHLLEGLVIKAEKNLFDEQPIKPDKDELRDRIKKWKPFHLPPKNTRFLQ